MELFERLIDVVRVIADGNIRAFSRKISINNVTFTGYLTPEGQQKVRVELLLHILQVFPGIQRDWLFFGEGEMLTPGLRMGERVAASTKPPQPTPVADAVREAELGLRRAGATDQLVWATVASIAQSKVKSEE